MWWLRSVCILLFWTAICRAHEPRPIVSTKEGVVRGLPGLSAAGKLFESFRGIPYARAPVGPLRFQPPQRHPGWTGVLDASAHRDKCVQNNPLKGNIIEGNEDCLFANVYTPYLPEQPIISGLPVMVWIHGGGFIFGDGNDEAYGPKYLVDGDVVLVTFNYRLGPFGLFTTEDANAPGNYGLRDQVILLQWVQDNIASFGGDPKLVTIFGESVGGASVSLLILSPLTKGLFHHAISQSGAANYHWAVSEKITGLAGRFAEKLNCPQEDSTRMIECIRSVNATFLQNQTQLDSMDSASWTFSPRVDRESSAPFLPDHPRLILEKGEFRLVPWMSGVTEEECVHLAITLTADSNMLAGLAARNHTAFSKILQIPPGKAAEAFDCGTNATFEIDKIIDFYVAKYGPVSAENRLPVVRLMTDYLMVTPIMEQTRLASAHAPVYAYILDHKGPGRLRIQDVWPAWSTPDNFGVGHGEDIPYLFSNNVTVAPARDSPAYTMVRFMVDVWTTFARTGRPGSTVLPIPEWPIYTEKSQRHMRLNSEPSIVQSPFDDGIRFWRGMPMNDAWKHPVRVRPCLNGGK